MLKIKSKSVGYLIGRIIGGIGMPYLAVVYGLRTLHDPTVWNCYWAVFWGSGVLSMTITSGIEGTVE